MDMWGFLVACLVALLVIELPLMWAKRFLWGSVDA